MSQKESLDEIADALRGLFQTLIRDFVRNKDDREALAEVLNRSPGHIKQMLYKGEGGLDVWTKALAYYYKLDLMTLQNIKSELRRHRPATPADKVWQAIREELGANDDDLYYLAKCAYEAFRVKKEIDAIKKDLPKRRGPKPK